jgi:hypothetical protein
MQFCEPAEESAGGVGLAENHWPAAVVIGCLRRHSWWSISVGDWTHLNGPQVVGSGHLLAPHITQAHSAPPPTAAGHDRLLSSRPG